MDKWFDLAYAPPPGYALTLGQLLRQRNWLPVLIMHRNFTDNYDKEIQDLHPKQPVPLTHFFAEAKAYIRLHQATPGHLSIDIRWSKRDQAGWGAQENDFEPDLLVRKDKRNRLVAGNRRQHQGCFWCPLQNGVINPGGGEPTRPQKWRTFPDATQVGFRGPMLLWSNLQKKDMPLVSAYEKADSL